MSWGTNRFLGPMTQWYVHLRLVFLFQKTTSENPKILASKKLKKPIKSPILNVKVSSLLILRFVKNFGRGKFPYGRETPRISSLFKFPSNVPKTGFPLTTKESGIFSIFRLYIFLSLVSCAMICGNSCKIQITGNPIYHTYNIG